MGLPHNHNISTTLILFSVRQKIRDGHPEFTVTGDYWPSLLYPHAKGDPKDAGTGIFKSGLLVKVSHHCFFQLGYVLIASAQLC